MITSTGHFTGKPSDQLQQPERDAEVDPIRKVLQGAEEIKKLIYEATGDHGHVTVQGRTLHYEVKGGFYKWEYQYRGKAWDEESGISMKSKGWQSAGGAREHALEDLVDELRKKGLLK
jgi:hypothetical protein